MAKKPAPLTSDLLVRKGEATPSSIDPAEQNNTADGEEEGIAATPTPTPISDDGRPQTPEPEIVLAADAETENDHGSRRRLAGVLALVAVVTAGFFAVRMFGPESSESNAPSVAPVGEELDVAATNEQEEQSVAPIIETPGPESTGTPTPPANTELRLETSDEIAATPAPEPAAPIVDEPILVDPAPVTPPREAATITPQPTTSPNETIAEVQTEAAPQPSATVAPAGKIAKPGQYLVQLLSVRSESAARSAWTRLQTAHAALLGDQALNLETADLGERGIYYRVRFGAYDARSDANAICASLKSAGQDCLVKRAN